VRHRELAVHVAAERSAPSLGVVTRFATAGSLGAADSVHANQSELSRVGAIDLTSSKLHEGSSFRRGS
jgi:hypothetical protein